jgi:hypothetical protein
MESIMQSHDMMSAWSFLKLGSPAEPTKPTHIKASGVNMSAWFWPAGSSSETLEDHLQIFVPRGNHFWANLEEHNNTAFMAATMGSEDALVLRDFLNRIYPEEHVDG